MSLFHRSHTLATRAAALIVLLAPIATGPSRVQAAPATDAPKMDATGVAAGVQAGAPELPAELESTPLTEYATLDAVQVGMEQALFSLVNADRAAQGVPPLEWDSSLLYIARTRASDQLPLARLSHLDAAGGIALGPLLGQAHIYYQLAGENLARLTGPAATAPVRAEEALMNSPDHRHAILQPRYDQAAIGAALGDDGRIVFAQIFRATGTAEGAIG